jgi:preprotein translocase subunit SecE
LAFAPVKFIREVRVEAGRVTWPGRRETLVTTGLVLAMATLAALFFFAVDLAAGWLVRVLFTGGN